MNGNWSFYQILACQLGKEASKESENEFAEHINSGVVLVIWSLKGMKG